MKRRLLFPVLAAGTLCLVRLAAGQGLELVGQRQFDFGLGDIWVHEQIAYLGTYGCGIGVQPVDVSNPANPRPLAPFRSSTLSTYEKPVVIRANPQPSKATCWQWDCNGASRAERMELTSGT